MLTRKDIAMNVNLLGQLACELPTVVLRGQSITAANTGLAKVAVQFSAGTFVVNQSLVLRINICGENRHLRQARNRYNALPRTDRLIATSRLNL